MPNEIYANGNRSLGGTHGPTTITARSRDNRVRGVISGAEPAVVVQEVTEHAEGKTRNSHQWPESLLMELCPPLSHLCGCLPQQVPVGGEPPTSEVHTHTRCLRCNCGGARSADVGEASAATAPWRSWHYQWVLGPEYPAFLLDLAPSTRHT